MGTVYTVVVVDHGSTDQTKSELPVHFPQVVHLLRTDDLWWSGATNVGIRYALEHGAEYVIPLNNDCFLTVESVKRLLAYASRGDAIVAPVQRESETRAIRAVRARPAIGLGFVMLDIEAEIEPGAGELIQTELIIGGRGAVIARRVFESVGLFAEDELPHYHADTDFYLRCRRAGIPLLIARDVDVLVDESRTSLAAVRAGDISWQDFRRLLKEPRSHRNIPALAAFFRRNYPIRPLWWIGLGLYLSRTSVMWLLARARAGFERRFSLSVKSYDDG